MNSHHYNGQAANVGGGTTDVPFYGFVAPKLHSDTVLAGLRAIQSAVKAINAWRWERTTRNELARLDNATLADIGVVRSEIPAIARVAAENPTFTATRRLRWTD